MAVAVPVSSIRRTREASLLDTSVVHGDGTTTAAKKGGGNLGFSGYKKIKDH